MPEVIVTTPGGAVADRDISKVIRSAVYGYQHNDVFDADLKYWTQKIADVDTPARGGGAFRIHHAPIYAGLFQKGRSPLPQAMQRHARQQGLVVTDANLLFSSANGQVEVKNPNPLKGLVENKPWDFSLTTSGLSPSVEIAAICPPQDAGKLKRFLNQFQERSQPTKSERDYLQDFPGFSSAFGLPLTYPNQGGPCWIDLDDAVVGDALSAAKELAHRICRALDAIRSDLRAVPLGRPRKNYHRDRAFRPASLYQSLRSAARTKHTIHSPKDHDHAATVPGPVVALTRNLRQGSANPLAPGLLGRRNSIRRNRLQS